MHGNSIYFFAQAVYCCENAEKPGGYGKGERGKRGFFEQKVNSLRKFGKKLYQKITLLGVAYPGEQSTL